MPTIATGDGQVTHATGVNVANLGCLLQDRLNFSAVWDCCEWVEYRERTVLRLDTIRSFQICLSRQLSGERR